MKVYKFRCKDCGSNKYEKLSEYKYKCKYCGGVEELVPKSEQKPKEPQEPQEPEIKEPEPETTKPEVVQMSTEDVHLLKDFLIVLFFGSIGLHKFLKGRIFMGFIYLFTHGLFGIGYIYDVVKALIRLAGGKINKDFY